MCLILCRYSIKIPNLICQFFFKLYCLLQTLLINGLLGTKVVLKPVAMTAIITICWRCLVLSNFSKNVFQMFIIKIFSIPLLIEHLVTLSCKVSICYLIYLIYYCAVIIIYKILEKLIYFWLSNQ